MMIIVDSNYKAGVWSLGHLAIMSIQGVATPHLPQPNCDP